MNKKSNTHGGPRKGAGRKASGRRQYTIRLRPGVHARIRSEARAAGKSITETIESKFPGEDA